MKGRHRTILVVCTANQCRSPMAAGLIRRRLAEAPGLDGARVVSAGTWTAGGLTATSAAVDAMAELGIDIGGHLAREITAELVDEADLILAMTANHAAAIRADFPAARGKLLLMSELDGGTWDIADPVGGTAEEYRATAAELRRLIDAGWEIIAGREPLPERP